MLLNEPLSGVDLAQQKTFEQGIDLKWGEDLTALMSGHTINHSLHHAHWVWLLDHGTLIHQGETNTALQPDILSAVYSVPFRRLVAGDHPFLTTLSDYSDNIACQPNL